MSRFIHLKTVEGEVIKVHRARLQGLDLPPDSCGEDDSRPPVADATAAEKAEEEQAKAKKVIAALRKEAETLDLKRKELLIRVDTLQWLEASINARLKDKKAPVCPLCHLHETAENPKQFGRNFISRFLQRLVALADRLF